MEDNRNLAFLDGALEGMVALVTGAGQGLGRDIAIAMTRAGATVAVVDLNGENAVKVAAELGGYGKPGLAITCDVGKRDQVDATVAETIERLGGIDVLVNNAQDLRVVQTLFNDTDEDLIRAHMESGFYGTYYFMRACYPQLKERVGRVINIGSGAGVSGLAQHFAYAATKEAIRATTRVTAREWGADGIRVNTICPAAYDTPSMQTFLGKADDATKDWMLNQIPLHKFGGGNEIASAAVFLASDASSFMTGHTFMVDGGSSMDAGR
ncbi:SDR family NAD(P)-dependent oxidoreductase [Streptomyces sp. JW3]|uniref:SDR family NAD(P)-dependent oxidoreductase n=1 Tax=Streptomyces sp. JW3 TaxID=3456955 RepID=UPI003FA4A2E7